MYHFIRNIHLILSLIITPFLFIFAVSSLFFSHSFLDFSSPEKKIEQFTLTSFSTEPAELAEQLSKKYNIHGNLNSSSIDDLGNIELLISRIGKNYKMVVNSTSGETTNEIMTSSTLGFIKALHTTAGFQNDTPGEWWWNLVIFIVAVILILILISGFILWAYRSKERRTGIIFLSLSATYSLSVLCILRFG